MSLFDDLRGIENFTPSRQPSSAELVEIVGKVIAYIEHGDELLQAAEADVKARDAGEPANHVNELLSPPPEEPPAPASTGASASGDAARIASLEQQVQTLLANQNRTQLDVESEDAVPPAPAPSPPASDAAPAPEGER